MPIFLQGLTMGLAYIMPIGPQNLFVINAALGHARRRALLTAWIVTFFDISLALACFFGVGAVLERYAWLNRLVMLAGGLTVLVMGAGLMRAKGEAPTAQTPSASLARTAVSACVVTWCNPQAILDGTMMLGAFRAALPAGQSLPFIAGVAAASCVWFTGLTLAVSVFHDRFTARVLRGVNVVCGTVLLFYGARLLLAAR